jgi:hypothetical protein
MDNQLVFDLPIYKKIEPTYIETKIVPTKIEIKPEIEKPEIEKNNEGFFEWLFK